MAEKHYYTPHTRGPPSIRANDITNALRGVDFPATKDRIVAGARANEAPDTVVRAIERLPGERYTDMVDVAKAFDHLHQRE